MATIDFEGATLKRALMCLAEAEERATQYLKDAGQPYWAEDAQELSEKHFAYIRNELIKTYTYDLERRLHGYGVEAVRMDSRKKGDEGCTTM